MHGVVGQFLACVLCFVLQPSSFILPGLSPAEVRERLGPPRFVARQVIYQAYLEQWTYGGERPCHVEFLYRRGQPPRVQSVRPLAGHNP